MSMEEFIARFPWLTYSEEARMVLRIAAPPDDLRYEYVLAWLAKEDCTPELLAYKLADTYKRIFGGINGEAKADL